MQFAGVYSVNIVVVYQTLRHYHVNKANFGQGFYGWRKLIRLYFVRRGVHGGLGYVMRCFKAQLAHGGFVLRGMHAFGCVGSQHDVIQFGKITVFCRLTAHVNDTFLKTYNGTCGYHRAALQRFCASRAAFFKVAEESGEGTAVFRHFDTRFYYILNRNYPYGFAGTCKININGGEKRVSYFVKHFFLIDEKRTVFNAGPAAEFNVADMNYFHIKPHLFFRFHLITSFSALSGLLCGR